MVANGWYDRARTVLSCGGGAANAQWDNNVNPGGLTGPSALGAECLINASTHGNNKGQDKLDNPLPWPTSPMQIRAESGLQIGNLVTTSSSIVTIPIIDITNSIPTTGGNVVIDGYMQPFINEVHGGGNPQYQGDIQVTVLNIAGCSNSSTNNGVTPVIGDSGTSPVPVRLITPPNATSIQNKPEQFVRKAADRKRFLSAINNIVGDLIVDVNAEIAGLGEDFDYRGKLRDSVWMKDLAKVVVGDHVKLVARGKIGSFKGDWQKI